MKKLKVLAIIILLNLTSCSLNKIKTMETHYFNFYTFYHQFYLEDKEEKTQVNSDFWSEEAFNSKLAIENGIIGIGTYSYGNIKGEIKVMDKANDITDYELYDHIVEGGINISSGELQILNCPNRHLELSLKVVPGKYRIRIYGSNFASVKDPNLANDSDDDYYKIELWPSDNMERKVLKQYIEK